MGMVEKNIAIVGGRDFENYDLLKKRIDTYLSLHDIKPRLIVSGGARGADTLAEKYASENNIECRIHYPEWDKYGRKAGFIRNEFIILDSDIVFAFWDGSSKGTKSSIDLSLFYGRELITVHY